MSCPNCGYHLAPVACPAEPPVGTWVRDRFGVLHQRTPQGTWARRSDPVGAYGRWAAMWEARGPLAECGPGGAELAVTAP